MPMLDDVVLSKAQHIMIYGEPFTGKTKLSSSVAELGFNVIWFSLDKGYSILKQLPADARKRVKMIIIPDTKDNPVGIKTMLQVITGARVEICDKHGEIGCARCRHGNSTSTTVSLGELGTNSVVVIDPISMLAESAMQFAVQRSINRKAKDANGVVESNPDFFKPGYEEYMLVQFMMNKILTNIQAAQYHAICITHVIESMQEDNTKKLVPYIGSSPYSINAPKFFDHIILSRIVNGRFTFGSTSRFLMQAVAGSRDDIIMENIDPPTLKPFFDGTIPSLGTYGDGAAEELVARVEKPIDSVDNKMVESIPIMNPADAAKAKLAAMRART